MIPTLCVPTLKDLTSVAVFVATKEMAGYAQVSLYCYLGSSNPKNNFYGSFIFYYYKNQSFDRVVFRTVACN